MFLVASSASASGSSVFVCSEVSQIAISVSPSVYVSSAGFEPSVSRIIWFLGVVVTRSWECCCSVCCAGVLSLIEVVC